jgi:hypothetical protein
VGTAALLGLALPLFARALAHAPVQSAPVPVNAETF